MENFEVTFDTFEIKVEENFEKENDHLKSTHQDFKVIDDPFNQIQKQIQKVDSKISFTNIAMSQIKESFHESAPEIPDHIIDLDVRFTKIKYKLHL